MLTKQQKIDAIYEKIANKELNFGCRFKVMIGDVMDWIEQNIEENGEKFKGFTYNGFAFKKGNTQLFRIPGIINKIYSLWKNKRLPLEEQSDDCISYIYNFIQ